MVRAERRIRGCGTKHRKADKMKKAKSATNGGNGGYSRKKGISDNPRTVKPTNGGIGPSPFAKRAQDGSRQNAKGK